MRRLFDKIRTRSRSRSSSSKQRVPENEVLEEPNLSHEQTVITKATDKTPLQKAFPPPALGSRGLYQLNDPENGISDSGKRYEIDIIAMHGLNGDIYRTWTKAGNYWLQDQLPKAIPGARIFSYGYPSGLLFSKSVAKIDDFALHLLESLEEIADESRSILFICHSLGGIVFKQTMSFAYHQKPDIWLRCKGVIFLGTPHRGSAAAEIAKTVASFVKKPSSYLGVGLFAGEIRTDLLEDLAYDSPKLANISAAFQERAALLLIHSFYESEKISGHVIVNRSSAVLDVPHGTYSPLYADHRDICRFENASSDNYKKVLAALLRMADEIQKQVTKKPRSSALSKKSLDDMERSCMEHLNIIDIATTYQAHLELHVEGTSEWIRSCNQYTGWITKANASLLWIYGPPGCGKTVLSSYISETISQDSSLKTIVCRFFCDARIKERQDPIIMLRSIIYQILIRRRRLIKIVRKARDLQGPQLFQQLSGLWELLLEILKVETKVRITIMIDSIDECEEPVQFMLLQRIEKIFGQIDGSAAKILITSRPHTSASYCIPKDSEQYFRLNLEDFQEEIGQDVSKVTKHRLNVLVEQNSCSIDLRDRIEVLLSSRAENTFLWVSLALLMLESKTLVVPADIEMLQKLPQTLTNLYKTYLQEMPETNRKIAGELLRIIACSGRPLRVNEMNLLLENFSIPGTESKHPTYTNEAIMRLLYPFVKVSDGRLVLIHLSVREYLLGLESADDGSLAEDFGINIGRDSLAIAYACMRYLLANTFFADLFAPREYDSEDEQAMPSESSSFEQLSSSLTGLIHEVGEELGFDIMCGQSHLARTFESDEVGCSRIREEFGLYDYASKFWVQLFSHSNEYPECDDGLRDMALSLYDPFSLQAVNSLRYLWTVTNTDDDSRPEKVHQLILSSYFGHTKTLRYLMEQEWNDKDVGQALYWASRRGNSICIELILKRYQKRIRHNPQVCSIKGLSPLAAAVQFGQLDCTQILLKQDIFDINAQNEGGQTILSLAVIHGHADIVSLLLQKSGTDPNIPDKSGVTAIFWTTTCNSQSILSILLKDRRIDPNIIDKYGRNALSWVAEEGQAALARQMIRDRRIDINNRDKTGRTPLLWAAQNLHYQIVKYLIESKRVDVSTKDNAGRNVISWTAERRDRAMMHYLIKRCPQEVDIPDDQGWTPLAWSLNPPGYNDNALLLLQSGLVDINFKDITGRSPLSFAVAWGYPMITETFLRFPKIEPNCLDGDGNTPIFEAVKHDNIDVMKVLLEAKKVDINFKNKKGQTPLRVAADADQRGIVKLLLSTDGIDTSCVTEQYISDIMSSS